ncbi:MAG: two component transcriptional regulator, winged helix family [Firmicutes bacterium]|nr:two component transcriptional regulator, winged helix family [Bacillota bacterium]
MGIRPLILVVEDERAIADFLSAQLSTSHYRVLTACTGAQAISMATSHCPDLVLLDLGLPDRDGLEILADIRTWSALPIVIVSARNQEEDIVQALDHGADDYITKPFSNSVLMARVRTALRKRFANGEGPARTKQSFGDGRLSIDYGKRLITTHEGQLHLTPVEYKMLTLLAQNAGQVLTYSLLRKELWGPYAGDNRALRVNMANLRRKIEENSADPQFLLTEIGVGYRMIESDDEEFD